jgi:hypothetical protein
MMLFVYNQYIICMQLKMLFLGNYYSQFYRPVYQQTV